MAKRQAQDDGQGGLLSHARAHPGDLPGAVEVEAPRALELSELPGVVAGCLLVFIPALGEHFECEFAGAGHDITPVEVAKRFEAAERGLRAIRASKNLYADLAGSEPVAGYTEMAVRELGAERIIYGSDASGRSFSSPGTSALTTRATPDSVPPVPAVTSTVPGS